MSIETRIFEQARKGTPANPGLPDPLAALLVAQAKHETGNFTSNAFIKHNNAFGYSYVPGGVYQSGSGLIADNGKPVAAYSSIENSVREVVDWIYRRRATGVFPFDLYTIRTPQQYAELLKNAGYYGDTLTNYSNALAHWFEKLSLTVKDNPIVSGGVVLVGVGLLFYYAAKHSR